MKTWQIRKAEPMMRSEPVESVTIVIDAKLPDFDSLALAQERYDVEASMIMDALRALPQGTRHALLIKMLEAHPNLYRGPG